MAAGCGQKAAETPEPKREVFPAIELSNMDTAINPAEETQEMRDKYVEHIANMFQLTGTESVLASEKAQHVLHIAPISVTKPLNAS